MYIVYNIPEAVMRLYANAKINLSLDVTGRRPDGYHEVSMIMQSVDLSDILDIEKNSGDLIILTCDNNDLACDGSNLIIRAAKALQDYVGAHDGLKIHLSKRIPMAAGIAGGSADAAAALVGVNNLCGYSLSIPELQKIGAGIGADIPFCIQGGTCRAEGIGEILTKISPMPDCHIVLIKPPFDVSTKYVYEHLDALDLATLDHPNTDAMQNFITDGDVLKVAANIGNILESVTVAGYPEISDIKNSLSAFGADGVLMSGSGPTVYGIFADEEKAKAAKDKMSSRYDQVYLCKPVDRGVIYG